MVAAAVIGGAVVGGVATTMAGNKAAGAQKDAARQASETELQMYNTSREDLKPYRETGYQALSMLSRGLGLPGYQAPGAPGGSSPLTFEEWMATNGSGYGDGVGGGMSGMIGRAIGQVQAKRDYDAYVQNFKPVIDMEQGPDGTYMPVGDLNRDFTMADFAKDPGYQFRMDEGQKALERSAAARGGLLSGGTGRALTRYGQDYGSQEYSNAYGRFNADRTTRFNRLAAFAGVGQTATNTTAGLGANAASSIADLQTQAGNARAANAVNTGNTINNTVGSIGQFYLQQQYMKNLPKTPTSYYV